jgi:hypothetical protein
MMVDIVALVGLEALMAENRIKRIAISIVDYIQ